MRISHAGQREFLGYQSQAGNTSAYSNGSEIHTAPLDSSLSPRVLLGLPIPGRNLLTAGGVSETPHTLRTPWTNHNQVCTTMNQKPCPHPCTSYHTRIMHGQGLEQGDHNINSRYESNITTRIRVKIQIITHRGHWPNSTSRSGNSVYAVRHSKKQKD